MIGLDDSNVSARAMNGRTSFRSSDILVIIYMSVNPHYQGSSFSSSISSGATISVFVLIANPVV